MRRATLAHTLAAASVAAGVALFFLPPATHGFYPRCPIHEYLHLDCPACGSTRALAALLHLDLATALHANALFVLLLPFAATAALIAYRNAVAPGPMRWPRIPAPAGYPLLAIAAVFSVVRNIS